MGKNNGAENETRGTHKRRNADPSSIGDRESRRVSKSSGNEPIGIGSQDRLGANFLTVHFAVVGGILTQLIDEERSQLGKHQECVEWYQREAERSQQRIQALEKLKDLMEGARNPSGEP